MLTKCVFLISVRKGNYNSSSTYFVPETKKRRTIRFRIYSRTHLNRLLFRPKSPLTNVRPLGPITGPSKINTPPKHNGIKNVHNKN